jgi:hypothetical protein
MAVTGIFAALHPPHASLPQLYYEVCKDLPLLPTRHAFPMRKGKKGSQANGGDCPASA